jgi:hypothetical protein
LTLICPLPRHALMLTVTAEGIAVPTSTVAPALTTHRLAVSAPFCPG